MFFLALPHHEQSYPEGLSAFAELDKVSNEFQGLSSTYYNFQGLSKSWIFTFKVSVNPVLQDVRTFTLNVILLCDNEFFPDAVYFFSCCLTNIKTRYLYTYKLY